MLKLPALTEVSGKKVLTKIPQKVFELTVVTFAIGAGIKLCFLSSVKRDVK